MNAIDEFVNVLGDKCLKDDIRFFANGNTLCIESTAGRPLSEQEQLVLIREIELMAKNAGLMISADTESNLVINEIDGNCHQRFLGDDFCFGMPKSE